MHRGFGGTAFEPAEEQRDKEFTLGPTMLVGLVVALVALCGLCFVFGYAVGHRGSAESQAATAQAAPGALLGASVAQATSSQPKPSASQSAYQPQQQVSADPSAAADTAAENAQSTDAANTSAGEAAVRTALPSQPGAVQPVAGGGSKVGPALNQASLLMVQIAAVSHPEDAEVLVGALRKRGYAVTARRDPNDGLMHVQIGPFANRNDANAMRQKLLNDGYNAIVQP